MTDQATIQWNDSDTALYLKYAPVFVPRRTEQLRAVCALLQAAPAPAMLELGCGDGYITEAVLERYEDATVTAIDASAQMLDAARIRLARFGDRVRLIEADLADTSWRTGACGAVVTSLAVHHLDHAEKRALYRSVHGLLVPGGVFVQADLVLPAPHCNPLAAQEWDRIVREQSQDLFHGDEASNLFAATRWNLFRYADPVDKPAGLADQLRWLAEAQFAGIDVVWAAAGHAVVTAVRPEVR